MDIIVLIKQVPDTGAAVSIAADGASIAAEGLKWVVNPYDEYAVEEALRINEAAGGGTVTVVSAGEARAAQAVRAALAMGADRGVLVNDPALSGADSLGVAKALAKAVSGMDFGLILAGSRAVDDEAGLVGPMVAQLLDIPHVSMATTVSLEGDSVLVEAATDGGTAVVRAPLPALVTAEKGLNEPRFASMMGIMKAKKKPLEEKDLSALGLSAEDVAAKSAVAAMSPPPARPPGKMISGDTPEQLAENLAAALADEAKVI
ncbi:MAG: electron transfer flavoprotein subunit beta/FixA family protein [Deltaproteobacteria bacterium]|nr:electron transfer flavoprotein subunit beta/FixA family protein [Deltaproteobacteria bacterium]